MARLDVRLDAERRRRLGELVEERGVPISEVVRCLIDDAYEDVLLARREGIGRLDLSDAALREMKDAGRP